MRLMRLAWLFAALPVCGGPCAAQVVSVTLQPPARDFGVFVGDELTSTATLQVLPGTTLDLRSLPQEGPVSASVDLRRVAVGGTPGRVEIRVTYQSFFSPEQVLAAEVPGYKVSFSAGGRRLQAAVPGFRFTASTFRHDLQPVLDPAVLRPDHTQAVARAPGAGWKMTAGLAAMACGVLALAWPFGFASRQAPFRKAARELAGLARKPGATAGREAMLVLHRAFDATAGRRLFAGDLDDFVGRHQRFLPLRERIGTFFEASRGVFFGAPAEAPDVTAWVALCDDLARAERLG